MKTRNFIKNSTLALLPISLGLAVLFGVPARSADSVDAYSGISLPTTIDLNDPSDSSIRSYYSALNSLSTTEKKGNNLLKNLKTILSNGQKYYNYDSGDLVWKMYEITDRDWDKSPAGSDSVGTYNSTTNVITDYKYSSNSSHTNNPYLRAYYMDRSQENVVRAWGNHNQDATGINREHLWAKAEGFDGSGAAGARGDPMHLVAANGYANNIHSNHFYGYVDKTRNYEDVKDKYSTLGHNYSGYSQTYPSSTITVFEPQDCDKGDIARAIFYMAARYNNIAGKSASQETFDADNPNLLLTDDLSKWKTSGYTSTATTPGYHGLITDLLEWNRIDPPDEYEIHRNNLLYTNFTNNRNPFIDFPDWADICWGNSENSADPISDALNGQSGAKIVTSLSIGSSPARTIYTEGETFNTKGLIVNANYSDGTSATITDYDYSPAGALSYGTNKVTISYENKTVNVPITVVRQSTSILRYFKKVTSNFTSGNYLIVADDAGVAWKNGTSSANDYIAVTRDDDENIVYTQELANAMFSFNLNNGSIFAPNGKYIYNSGSNTTILFSDEPVSQTISLSSGILNVSNDSRVLKFNRTDSNQFFRFYASPASSYYNLSAYTLVEEYEEIVHPTSVVVSPSTLTLEIGNSSLLSAQVNPSDATENTVTWSSDDTDVVTVDQSGRVVVVGAGTAHVTAKSNDSEVNISGSCTITVSQPIILNSLTVTGNYKKIYYVGEEFDMTDLVVNAIYTQGGQQVRVENVTDDAEFSGFDTSDVGKNTVTVSYNGLITSFDINVLAVPVEENTIKIITSAEGYENGVVVDALGKDNFVVVFDKGTGSVTPKYYTSGSAIRVYGGNTFTITGPYKITQIKIVLGTSDGSNPISVDKGTYDSSTSIWISASGEDTVKFTIGGSSGNRRISEIHIKYNPGTISTKELLSISLSGSHQTSFDVGDSFDYTGLIVTAHYNDGTSATVTPASVTGANMDVAGEQEITVSYTEDGITKSATYNIYVNETIVLTGITLSGNQKRTFYVGDQFVRTGLVVTAHYSDESTKQVTPTSVSGYDMNNPSDSQTVTVTYSENDIEVSDSYTITVLDILPTNLEVSDVEKTDYIVGDNFNDSFTTTVTYNNGFEQVVTPTNIDGYDMSKVGEYNVNVEYTEKNVTVSDSFTINVGQLLPESLEITGDFDKNFYVGDTFNYDGLVATVTYNNGKDEDVSNDVVVSSPDMTTAGTKPVTVFYTFNDETVSETYNIVVTAIVHKVTLSSSSLTIDLHDLAKQTLTATVTADQGADYTLEWSVGNSQIVSIIKANNSIEITPLIVGSTTITASAGGKQASCLVTVTSKVSSIVIDAPNVIAVGNTVEITASVAPSDAENPAIEWSSSNSNVLSVSVSGNKASVTAYGKAGESAIITAKAKDGSGVSSSISITIIGIEYIRIDYSGLNNDNKVPFAKYKAGQPVDARVTAVWTDGSTTDVTSLSTINFTVNCLVLGEQTISASYKDFEASLNVRVTNEGSAPYVGITTKSFVVRADSYNATPLQQAEAWADYFIKQTGGGEFDGPCKLPEAQRKAALQSVWTDLNAEYGFMANASKDEFCNTSTTSVKIAEAMNHYKFICNTYSLEQFVTNGSNVKPVINNSNFFSKNIGSISVALVGSLLLIGTIVIIIFFVYKKRKLGKWKN